MGRIGLNGVVVLAVACAASGRALAQQPMDPSRGQPAARTGDERPWAKGVAKAEQERALELFRVGNQEFTESRFPQALVKYKEAIRHWDHPAIRFNMAVSLINLDQPIEASQNLERSLAYGAAPLSTNLHRQGITYRKLLAAQLVRLRIASADAGAKISLDGKVLFTAPGRAELVVLPGEHQVVATKEGFLTVSETFAVAAAKGRVYEVRPTLEPKPAPAPSSCSCYSPPDVEIPQLSQKPARSRTAVRALALPPPSMPMSGGTQPRSMHAPVASTSGSRPSVPKTESTWAAIVRTATAPTPPSSTTTSAGAAPPSASDVQTPNVITPPVMQITRQELLPPTTLTTPTGFQLPSIPTLPPIPFYQLPMPQPPIPQLPYLPDTPTYQPPTPTYQPPTFPSAPLHHQPTYQPPTPTYQPPTPTYQPPTPTYQPPTPTYQPRTYQPPTPTYQPPTPTYHTPTPTYHTPTYQPPTPTYQPPTPTYQPPAPPTPTYRPPTPTYQPPTPTYNPPTYRLPTPTYNPPTYRSPTPTYNPPTYRSPTPTYNPPTPIYRPR